MNNYKLVWEDDFNGNTLDNCVWNYELFPRFTVNEELQDYTNDSTNIFIKDSCLEIRATQENKNPAKDEKFYCYKSARINTIGKKSWLYGKIEGKIKLPYGQGIWPAFWMLGENIVTEKWPGCGEIDIMEMIGGGIGRDDTVCGTLHWKDKKNNHIYRGNGTDGLTGYCQKKGLKLCEDFHIFGVEWDKENIKWIMDGVQFFEISIKEKEMYSFHKPFYIILNLAIGGIWPGNPDNSTIFPQTILIDWIRVHQR